MRKLLVFAGLVFAFAAATAAAASAQDIQIVNQSAIVSNAQLEQAMPAFQQSIDEGLAPAWNTSAVLYGPDQVAPPDAWQIVVQDSLDVAGAAGYHTMLAGTPIAYIDADQSYTGLDWQLIFSHELDEMLVDPWIDRAAGKIVCNMFGCTTKVFHLEEVCDPVEYNSYTINGTTVSDFVTPRWFQGYRLHTDYLGLLDKVHKRFGLTKGGYTVVFKHGQWYAQEIHKMRPLRGHPR